jgi:DNA-binding transcriptional MerR regulator
MKDFGLKKLYYSISEVSRLTGLEQYILRYWETEFEQLRPGKNRAGNRIYTNKDIKLILQIKRLLREEKYTIEGAKKILDDFLNEGFMQVGSREQKTDRQQSIGSNPVKKDFEEIKNVLVQVYKML